MIVIIGPAEDDKMLSSSVGFSPLTVYVPLSRMIVSFPNASAVAQWANSWMIHVTKTPINNTNVNFKVTF
ncbi:MAG: hypothetical protein ACJAVN_001033 [Roseivirga sp.]|jgi:hypothetical protein